MKKILITAAFSLIAFNVAIAGAVGKTKSPGKNNNTNVFNESMAIIFNLPDGITVDVIGPAELNVPFTEGQYVKIKVLEGTNKGKIGIVGKKQLELKESK